MNYTPIYKCTLVREGTAKTRPVVNSSERAKTVAYEMLKDSPCEQFIVIALDTKNKVVGSHVVSTGVLNAILVHPREVFRFAILTNAARIIVAHNHPSGDTRPSREDIEMTKRLMDVGKSLGIPVLDSLIVGEDEVASYADGWSSVF